MLKMFVERTQTFAVAVAKDKRDAHKKLDAAIGRAAVRHGAEWERNLVAAWGTLNATEIKQVCSVLGSPKDPAFMQFATRVAPAVRSRNEPLLKRAATEVLEEISN